MVARALACSLMNTLHTQTDLTRREPYREPAPLTGRKLVVSWIALFSLGWLVVLALFGVLHWLLN